MNKMRKFGEERKQSCFTIQADIFTFASEYLISWLDRELDVEFSPFDPNYPAAVGRQP